MAIIFLLLHFIYNNLWIEFEILSLIVLIFLIKKFTISGQKVAAAGMVLLFITMFFSIFRLDYIAGKIAEFVWILFSIAFVQEFYHFLKHENK